MVVLVGLVRAEDAKEVVVASAEELKEYKGKEDHCWTKRKDHNCVKLIEPNSSGG